VGVHHYRKNTPFAAKREIAQDFFEKSWKPENLSREIRQIGA
jgi:hypothetical protein